MKTYKPSKSKLRARRARFASAAVAAAASINTAWAFNFDTGNPDIAMSLDNVVRYNTAWRMKDRDPGLANNLQQDESDYLYDKNDLITNRVDLYSEFDFRYQDWIGFRVSGQAWYDAKYGDGSKARPDAVGQNVAVQNIKGQFNGETRRYYHGPSAEFLDAFVWATHNFDDSSVIARFGRHSVLWGESLIGNTQAVSYAQQPSDARKGLQSPGASAKETALPVNQTTGTWQFRPDASLSWQYQFEWKPNRLSLGGTYFGLDPFSPYINANAAGTFIIPRADPEKGEKGAWGLMLKWHPELVDADLGLVYREFSDTNPWAAQLLFAPFPVPVNGRYVYARDIKLWGLTFNKTVSDIAIGAEVSHRENMALLSTSLNAGAAGRFEGAIGDTWHAILNATAAFGSTPLWDTSSIAAELQYAGLDKVTKNKAFYKGRNSSAACRANAILNSCATSDFFNFGVVFTPSWQQVIPGLDLSLQNTYVVGLKGTAPTNGGGNESSGQYKIDLIFDYRVQHKLELAYTAFLGKKRYTGAKSGAAPFLLPVKTNVGGGNFADRDWFGVTYSYNF